MLLRYNSLRYTKNITKNITRNIFDYKDAFLLENQINPDEKLIKELAYNFSKNILQPNIILFLHLDTKNSIKI